MAGRGSRSGFLFLFLGADRARKFLKAHERLVSDEGSIGHKDEQEFSTNGWCVIL